jgi:hypothetical protein
LQRSGQPLLGQAELVVGVSAERAGAATRPAVLAQEARLVPNADAIAVASPTPKVIVSSFTLTTLPKPPRVDASPTKEVQARR